MVESTALVALRAELANRSQQYETLLPKGYRPERLITGAMLAVSRNPDLLKCSPVSVAVALGQVALLGLDVGTTAHLVPFGNTCTFVADYKGYIELMCQAGARKVEAYVVREGDKFEWEHGTAPFLRHQPLSSTKPITHAYALVWGRRDVVPQFEVMAASEIDTIRQAKSKSWKGGPLTEWYARKTVIRRIAKYVPKNAKLAALLQAEEGDGGELVDQPGSVKVDGTDLVTGEVVDHGTT